MIATPEESRPASTLTDPVSTPASVSAAAETGKPTKAIHHIALVRMSCYPRTKHHSPDSSVD
ncbi:hypothetical protein QFZ57_001031 [Arthrobacter sp. B1I2]|nr:hypothetical protein [Arthrobacter sp. B1I2]